MKTIKYAVRIVEGSWYDSNTRLFAVVEKKHVEKYRELARKSIPVGSTHWVTVDYWNSEFYNV